MELISLILKRAAASPARTPWMWTLIYGHHEDRSPTQGYQPTREAAMAAFAKSWRRKYRLGLKNARIGSDIQSHVRLTDQARGCQNDPCDECSHAAIQQDFINDVGHDKAPLQCTLTKR